MKEELDQKNVLSPDHTAAAEDESTQQAMEDAERLANAVNQRLWENERLLLDSDENTTIEGQTAKERKSQRKRRERSEL